MVKIYLIAGEPSGDALGGRLMKALKKKDASIQFFGVGGESMEKEGLRSLFDISDLAIMGLAEVIPSIPKVLARIYQTVENIARVQPDVVVTIDSWSFSSRVHKALRKKKFGITQVHYVAPQVWAWKKKRARTMYKYIDHLLTLLPQEPKYFTPYHLKTTFVGHPVIESSVATGGVKDFHDKFNISDRKKIVSVLPGSRHNEVSRLLPIFLAAAERLYAKDHHLYFVIPTVKTVAARVRDIVKNSKLPLSVIEGEEDRHNAIKASSVAMAASGTVALELAIANVPHIVAYRVSPLSAFIARLVLKIQFVNLSNILLGREIVPELIQERCVSGNIEHYLEGLLKHDALYDKQMSGFKKVRELLGMGKQTPSEKAANVVLHLAKHEKCAPNVDCIYDVVKK